MSALDEFRSAYPEYAEWDDRKLASALYEKFGQGKDKFDFWLEVTGKGERATPFETGVAGLKSAFQTLGAVGLQRLGYEEEAQKQLEAAKAREEEVAGRYKKEVQSFSDIGLSPTRLGKYLYETTMESAPSMIPSVVGGIAGGIVGGPVGAGIGATAANVPVFTASNVQRQVEEGKALKDIELGKAVGTAIPQATADALIGRYLPGIGKAGTGSLLTRSAAKAIEGGVYGSASEGLQQALEILQANPEKLMEFGPEVRRELVEAAVAGGMLEGTTGALTGATGKGNVAPTPPAPPTPPGAGPVTPPVTAPAQPGGPGGPGAGPVTPPVVPPITGPEAPMAENDWLKANRDALQAFNETPIQTPVADEKGDMPDPVEQGKMRLFYDPFATKQDGTYDYKKDASDLEKGGNAISFIDIVPDPNTIKVGADNNTVNFNDPQIEQDALKGSAEYTYRPAKTAPATFANMVDKALYAIAKKTDPAEYNLAKDYLTQGLGMTEADIDAQSKDVETKVDAYLSDRKQQIDASLRGPGERIITPDISGKPTVVTFPGSLDTSKIGGIDINTTDPVEKAKLQRILADTKTNYTGTAKAKLGLQTFFVPSRRDCSLA
jgi:hypothetical protein